MLRIRVHITELDDVTAASSWRECVPCEGVGGEGVERVDTSDVQQLLQACERWRCNGKRER